MIWSVSDSKTFKRCQRQWYYKKFLANARAKDAVRRKAYLLSKLQSISAWRGNVVDRVISEQFLLAVRVKRPISLAVVKQHARNIFHQQLSCARRHQLHDPAFSPSALGSAFSAFHCMEYEGRISEEEIDQAWTEVEVALGNLFEMHDLLSRLKSATYVIDQRALTFVHSGMTVRAVPDVIAFYDEAPPLIVDWKVHAFGLQDALFQLTTYALALTRCSPHRDFPTTLGRWSARDVQLSEVQLLTNQIRQYSLSEEDLERTEAYIAESAVQMALASEGKKNLELQASDFPATRSPDVCQRCPYRSLCWEAVE